MGAAVRMAMAAGDSDEPVANRTGKYASKRTMPAVDIARVIEPAAAARRMTSMSS